MQSSSPLVLQQTAAWLDSRDFSMVRNSLRNTSLSVAHASYLLHHAAKDIYKKQSSAEDRKRLLRSTYESLKILRECFGAALTSQALNHPLELDLTLLERIIIFPDSAARLDVEDALSTPPSLIGVLISFGADTLRENAFTNALHRVLETTNLEALNRIKESGIQLNAAQSRRALEYASLLRPHALRALSQVFQLDLNTVLSDGGCILHWIVRTQNADEALAKLDYCSERAVLDRQNEYGLYATDMARYTNEPRIVARMETLFSRERRPTFTGKHPFEKTAERLKAQHSKNNDVAHYLIRCAKYGLRGENKVYAHTGYGVGAIAIELADLELLRAAFMEGETVNSKVPKGASLLGYAALMYDHCKDQRAQYAEIFKLLLQQPSIDWDMYDKDGMSVRMWVEYALMDKSECHIEDAVLKMLEASERSRLLDLTRVYA